MDAEFSPSKVPSFFVDPVLACKGRSWDAESVKMSIEDIGAALPKEKADAHLASSAAKFASIHSSV